MKPRILCAECGKEIHLGDQRCPNCGKAVEWQSETDVNASAESSGNQLTCNRCGTQNAVDATFCSSCGAKLQGVQKQQPQSSGKPAKQEEMMAA